MNAFHSTNLFCCFSRYQAPANSVAPPSVHKPHNTHDSLRGRRPKGKERGKTRAWNARKSKIGRGRIGVGDACKDAIVFFLFRPLINYAKPTQLWMSSCQNYPIRITPLLSWQICRRQCVLLILVFVVFGEKINFKIWRPSDVGKSEKKPVQKENNCNGVCKVCQVNLKVTYGKSVAKACKNIFKLSAGRQIRSWWDSFHSCR